MPATHLQAQTNLLRRIPAALYAVLFGTGGGVLLALGGTLVSPLMALMGLLGSLVVVMVFMLPDIGVLLSVFVVPLERLGRFADDSSYQLFSLMRVVGLLAISSLALHMALTRVRIRFPVPLLLYSAFLCIAVISFLFAYNPFTARGHLGTLLGNLMFLVLIVNGVRDWRMVKLALYAWLFITIVIGVFQVVDWHFGSAIEADELGTVANRFSTTWNSASESKNIGVVRRATGTTSNAAVYGINLMLTVPFFIYLAKVARHRVVSALLLLGLLLVLYNMMLTNTRAVIVFGAFMLLYCVVAGLVRITPSRIVTFGLGLLTLLLLMPEAIWRRVLDPANYSASHSTNIRARFDLWQAGFRLGLDNWLIGVGPGDREQIIRYLKNPLDAEAISAHNEFIQTFADVGLVGWMFFFGFVLSVLVYCLKAARRYRDTDRQSERYWFLVACQISLVTTVLFGIQVDVFHFSVKGWWLVAGLVIVIYIRSTREEWSDDAGDLQNNLPPKQARFSRNQP